MLPLQFSRFWRIASIVLLVLVLAATMLPAAWLFDDKTSALRWFVHADKWLHALTFLALALWFAGQYQARSYWRVAIGLMGFGLLIELCQLTVSYRTADWIDIGANTAGIIAGLAMASAGLGGWCLRVEAWHMARNDGSRLD